MDNQQDIIHPFPPVFSCDCRVLILGTMPSRESRRLGFYYGHPQNRFWEVLAALFQEDVPAGTDERRRFLLRHHIAVWDVLQSCRITGSQDSSISHMIPNDIQSLISASRIKRIFANGQTAARIYRSFCQRQTGQDCQILPSTSPANAHCSLAMLIEAWQPVRSCIEMNNLCP
jgi:double-stranded uracil-DNA glycosylase